MKKTPPVTFPSSDSQQFDSPTPSSLARSKSTRALLATPETAFSGSDSGRRCRVTKFEVTVADKKDVNPRGEDFFFIGKRFSVDAEFTDGGDGACSCCQYRQYLRGFKKRKPPGQEWQTEQIKLWNNVLLSETDYNEDGDPTEANGVFGHRDIKCPVDSYGEDEDENVTRDIGCIYHAADQPGETYITGTEYHIHLEFEGVIIDTCHDNARCEVKHWVIDIEGSI